MSEITLKVDDLSHDGAGVARNENGKVYFINGALPGETVSAIPQRKRRGRFDAKLVDIIEASADRVTPRCEYFDICGGCSLQHLSESAQLQYKQRMLESNLRKQGQVEPATWLPILTGEAWGYRRKARPGVKLVPKKGGVLVGFREPQSSYLTNLPHCETLHPKLSALLPEINALVTQLSIPDRIPQIEMAAGDNAVALVMRHLEPLTAADLDKIRAFAQQQDVQFLLQPAGLPSIAPLWPENPQPLHYKLPKYDLTMTFQPVDFIQVNAQVNELMIDQALELLAIEPGDVVADLFCGLGNFTLPMGRSAGQVIGLEGDAGLVQRANSNAESHGLDNVRFQLADLHQEGVADKFPLQHVDRMLLDPPRSGAYDVVKEIVPRVQPKRIVYVSCNPATLARDAGHLVNELGYQLTHAGIMDMFPHTAHVESMAVFDRA